MPVARTSMGEVDGQAPGAPVNIGALRSQNKRARPVSCGEIDTNFLPHGDGGAARGSTVN